jgi:hypothetical protein
MRIVRFTVLAALLLILPAQATAQGVVGCSVVPSSWGAIQQGLDAIFFGACTRHDFCYRTCNPPGGPYVGYGYKASCDTVLYAELLLACETWSLILSFPNVEWVNQQDFLNECATYASYGYAAVLSVGTYVFLDGQCTYRCNAWACTQLGRIYGSLEQSFCDTICGWGGIDRDDCDLFPFGPDCPICPVGLDLQGNGLKLTGPTPAVHFDLDADGDPDRTSWTHMQTKDGWLVLDRNQNGLIDDGRELFGNATPMMLSGNRAIHGFEALEEFDRWALGGNEDGVIDAGDAIFGALQVWLDKNRDAVSQPGELLTLSELSIESISLSYFRDDGEDQWGNTFRWWGPIYFEDGSESMAVDVFFQRVED